MISLEQAVELVWHAFEDMVGGEIYVKKIPSMKMTDLARVIAPNSSQKMIGIRPGEKLHEQMISSEDSSSTYEYIEHFKILPQIHDWQLDSERIKDGESVPDGFTYESNTNSDWMSDEDLRIWLEENREKIGRI